MTTKFIGKGNLGDAPTLKQVEVKGEKRPVAELRVYFDRLVSDGDDGFVDKGGFWLNVNYWGTRGEKTAKLLCKGARVRVEGTLVEHKWDDKESGEERTRFELIADDITLDLGRVESFVLQKKSVTVMGEHEEADL